MQRLTRLKYLLRWRRWARLDRGYRGVIAIPVACLAYVVGETVRIWFDNPAFPGITCAADTFYPGRTPCSVFGLIWEAVVFAGLRIVLADEWHDFLIVGVYLAVLALWALAHKLAGPGPDILDVNPSDFYEKSAYIEWTDPHDLESDDQRRP
jgi:hypothetical protein